jgi:hypothetical protein
MTEMVGGAEQAEWVSRTSTWRWSGSDSIASGCGARLSKGWAECTGELLDEAA